MINNEEESVMNAVLVVACAVVGLVFGAISYELVHIKTMAQIDTLEKVCRSYND